MVNAAPIYADAADTMTVRLQPGKTMFLYRKQTNNSKLRGNVLYQYNISVEH